MKRRGVLTMIGTLGVAGIGGCIGNATGSGSRTLTDTAADDAPDPLSFGISVSETELSSETVPTLGISAENTGREDTNWSYVGQTSGLPFPQGVHTSGSGVLVIGLLEEVKAQVMDVPDGCSRVGSFLTADGVQRTALSPGDRVEETYAMVGVDQELNGNCPAPGTYRIETEIGDLGTWGFEFTLE